jgi:hypothetical protein
VPIEDDDFGKIGACGEKFRVPGNHKGHGLCRELSNGMREGQHATLR